MENNLQGNSLMDIGKSHQKIAKVSFEAENFSDARISYLEAENAFRKIKTQKGYERTFYAMCTRLRCLEKLLDDTPSLFTNYINLYNSFITEWSDKTIEEKIPNYAIKK